MTKRTKPVMIETIAVAAQAPDAPQGSDETVVKKRTAQHDLLDASGNVVENEEDADGIRYTLLENGEKFEYQFGKNAGTDKLLAIFGAKTLCTNESSAIRNNPKGAGTADEQIDAVRERFALLDTGKWVDRTRDGVGARVDKDKLAEAIILVMIAQGKLDGNDQAAVGTTKADRRQRLEENAEYLKGARSMPAVAAEYAKLMGRTTMSLDAL